jgi:hypothetical protein
VRTGQKIMKNSFITAIVIGLLFTSIFAFGCMGKDYVPNGDIKVLKLDPNGTEQWNTTIDSGGDDRGHIIVETSTGGYIIAGEKNSVPSGIRIPRIVGLDKRGTVITDRDFPDTPLITSMVPVAGGRYVAASAGERIFGLDERGETVWEVPLASRLFEKSTGISISTLISSSGDKLFALADMPGSKPEIQIIMLTVNGTVEQKETYLLQKNQSAASFIQTRDGGYAVAGYTTDPVMEQGTIVQVNVTGWITKTDRNGTLLWNSAVENDKTFKNVQINKIWSLRENSDGNIALLYNVVRYGTGNGGTTETVELSFSQDGTVSNEKYLNANGPVAWTSDGGYVFAAFPVPQKTGYADWGYGSQSMHVITLDNEGVVTWDTKSGITHGGAESIIQTRDGGYAVLMTEE